jgi:rRNA small subunit pseudouridine methyltransferase Nep1
LVLDRSYHHAAMMRLRDSGVGRGRPDIVHFSLLTALGSPLNVQRELQCFVHTRDDHVITIDSRARLPRNTDRFTSLLEKLFHDSVVPSSGPALMSLSSQTLQTLIQQQGLDEVVALSTQGIDKPLEKVTDELQHFKKPAVLVGGFPKGHFSSQTIKLSAKTYRVDKRRLEAWTVVGRTIYDYEKSIRLKRF